MKRISLAWMQAATEPGCWFRTLRMYLPLFNAWCWDQKHTRTRSALCVEKLFFTMIQQVWTNLIIFFISLFFYFVFHWSFHFLQLASFRMKLNEKQKLSVSSLNVVKIKTAHFSVGFVTQCLNVVIQNSL